MKHIVSLSGGISSAVAAERVVERYGRDNVTLWFADTSYEDEDLYSFLTWLEKYLQLPIIRYRDGRNPLQVSEDAQIIANQKIAPCTFKLKIEPFVKFVKEQMQHNDITVHIGYNWSEPHRQEPTRRNYEKLGVACDFPLMWQPVETRNVQQIASDWWIELPRMYRLGYSHNNCGGRCVKQGLGDWYRTSIHFPDRFAEVAEWEARMRQDERFKNYAIARDQSGGKVVPLPLYEIPPRMSKPDNQTDFLSIVDDRSMCYCNAGDPGELK